MARYAPPQKLDGTFDDSPEERTKAVNLRLTEKEHAELTEAARMSGRTISDYIRSRAMGHPVISRVDQIMVNELCRVGGLQKRWFNERLGHPEETAETLREVRRVVREIGEYARSKKMQRDQQ